LEYRNPFNTNISKKLVKYFEANGNLYDKEKALALKNYKIR
jgi:hypothetical protein